METGEIVGYAVGAIGAAWGLLKLVLTWRNDTRNDEREHVQQLQTQRISGEREMVTQLMELVYTRLDRIEEKLDKLRIIYAIKSKPDEVNDGDF